MARIINFLLANTEHDADEKTKRSTPSVVYRSSSFSSVSKLGVDFGMLLRGLLLSILLVIDAVARI